MASQTYAQRQAAGKKAAASRKQNQSKRQAAAANRSAARGRRSAATASRDAQGAATQATRAGWRGLEAIALQVDALGRQGQRVLLVEVGAALEARDAVARILRTYSSRKRLATGIRRLERRGATALKRSRRRVEREANTARRDLRRQANEFRDDAAAAVSHVPGIG